VLGGLAEFERELIRTPGEGRARAVANGVRLGRKPTLKISVTPLITILSSHRATRCRD
jgi:DNA invertase Pin-like site-specific DNA recombinase